MQLTQPPFPRRTWPWLCSALVFGALLSFRPIADSDAGWHLALGRLIANGHFPRSNTLSWTQPEHAFYPTSWLFDWACFHLWQWFGAAGVQLLVFGFVATALVAVAAVCSKEGHGRWLVLPICLLLADRIVARPHVASWAVLALCTLLCVVAEGRGWRLRAACLPLIALGSNLHAGAVFSSALLGLFALAAAIRERSVHGFLREGLIATGGILALMANPGGTYNLVYAFEHLRVTETLMLTEFERPDLSNAPGFFVLAPAAAIAALLIAKRRAGLAAASVVFLLGGVFAVRLAFKFYLVSAPAFAAALGVLEQRFGVRALRYAALGFFGVALVSSAPVLASLNLGARFDEQWIPVRAVDFAKRVGLDGKVWTGFNDGGYFEWAYPEVPAYQDARVQAYDPAFFHEQQRAQRSPEDFTRYLEARGVEWALTTNLPGDLSGSGLLKSDGWALVYWDDLSEIYVRRDVPRFAPVIAKYEYRRLHPFAAPEALVALAQTAQQAQVLELEEEVARFEQSSPRHPVGLLGRCAVATRLQRPDATQVCDEARRAFESPELRALVDRAATFHSVP